jgi:hypothetical protein
MFTQPIARIRRRTALMVLAWSFTAVAVHAQTDPLPSWNDGAAKQRCASTPVVRAQGLPESRVGTFTQ